MDGGRWTKWNVGRLFHKAEINGFMFFEFTYNAQHTIAQRVFLIRWTMDVVFS
jgi:hypothetical protein